MAVRSRGNLASVASCLVVVASGCSAQAPREETTVSRAAPPAARPAQAQPAPPPSPPAVQEPRHQVSFDVREATVADVMDLIARRCGKNIAVEPGIDDRVTLSLHDISWRDAVDFVAERTHCEVNVVHGVVYVTQPPRVSISTLPW